MYQTETGKKKAGKQKSRPFSLTAWVTLDFYYHYETLDDRLKHGSIVITQFLSKSKDEKKTNTPQTMTQHLNLKVNSCIIVVHQTMVGI